MWNSTRGGAFVKESLLRCRGRQRAAHRKKYGQSKIEIVSGPLPCTIKRKKEKKEEKKAASNNESRFFGKKGGGGEMALLATFGRKGEFTG